MKGWILLENHVFVITSVNSYEIFRTKQDLLDYYGGALGDLNTIKKVEVHVL